MLHILSTWSLTLLGLSSFVVSQNLDLFEVQMYLREFGYLEHENENMESLVDEDFLHDSIIEFQNFMGLERTGTLDSETIELMTSPRCGIPDRETSNSRWKRGALFGTKWNKPVVTYRISKYSGTFDSSTTDTDVEKAFQVWSNVIRLQFKRVSGESENADIDIRFERGAHGGVCEAFDGPHKVLAHAYKPTIGRVHFDDDESWSTDSEGINFFQVAVHEFGHALGLKHSNVRGAIMFPTYQYSSNFKLHPDDIQTIQELYGRNTKQTPTRSSPGGGCNCPNQGVPPPPFHNKPPPPFHNIPPPPFRNMPPPPFHNMPPPPFHNVPPPPCHNVPFGSPTFHNPHSDFHAYIQQLIRNSFHQHHNPFTHLGNPFRHHDIPDQPIHSGPYPGLYVNLDYLFHNFENTEQQTTVNSDTGYDFTDEGSVGMEQPNEDSQTVYDFTNGGNVELEQTNEDSQTGYDVNNEGNAELGQTSEDSQTGYDFSNGGNVELEQTNEDSQTGYDFNNGGNAELGQTSEDSHTVYDFTNGENQEVEQPSVNVQTEYDFTNGENPEVEQPSVDIQTEYDFTNGENLEVEQPSVDVQTANGENLEVEQPSVDVQTEYDFTNGENLEVEQPSVGVQTANGENLEVEQPGVDVQTEYDFTNGENLEVEQPSVDGQSWYDFTNGENLEVE